MSRSHQYVALHAYHGMQRPGGTGGQGSLGPKPPPWSKGGRKTSEEFDPVTAPSTWTSFSGPGWSGVAFHTSDSRLSNGKYLLQGTSTVDRTDLFDESDNSYTATDPGPDNQAGELIRLPSGNGLSLRTVVGQTKIYDTAAGTWSATLPGVARLDGGEFTLCRTETVGKEAVYFCGKDRGTGNTRKWVQTFNEATETWTDQQDWPNPLNQRNMVSCYIHTGPFAGQVFVGGGGVGSTERYEWYFWNPATDTYTQTTTNDSTTYLSDCNGVVQLGSGEIYLCGGSGTNAGSPVNRTVIFNPEDETWAVDTNNNLPWAVDNGTCNMSQGLDGTIYLHRSGTSYYGNIVAAP